MTNRVDAPAPTQPVRSALRQALRSNVVITTFSWSTAVAAAWILRSRVDLPMLSRPVYAAGSAVALVAGVVTLSLRLAQLKRTGASAVRPQLIHALFWICVCWGLLAAF